MRHVVLDEADLLLTGGYEKDTQRILQAFLEGDRQQRASAAAERFGLTDDMLQRMPRLLRKAAQKGRPRMTLCRMLCALFRQQKQGMLVEAATLEVCSAEYLCVPSCAAVPNTVLQKHWRTAGVFFELHRSPDNRHGSMCSIHYTALVCR